MVVVVDWGRGKGALPNPRTFGFFNPGLVLKISTVTILIIRQTTISNNLLNYFLTNKICFLSAGVKRE